MKQLVAKFKTPKQTKDWYIKWGHELENFDDKKKCFNLLLKKSKWNEIKNGIYNKLNFK